MLSAKEITQLWFNELFEENISLQQKLQVWCEGTKRTDRYLRQRLIAYTVLASEDGLDAWKTSAQEILALVLLLDRVSRACYRRTSMAFSNDKKARTVSLYSLDRWGINAFSSKEGVFLLFPLMVSDKLSHLLLAKSSMRELLGRNNDEWYGPINQLLELVKRNVLILRKFSRYPHRAKMQGFALTRDEQIFVSKYSWQDWM